LSLARTGFSRVTYSLESIVSPVIYDMMMTCVVVWLFGWTAGRWSWPSVILRGSVGMIFK